MTIGDGEGRTGTRVPKASDILANRLTARVLGQGLEPGERLPSESELMETYDFSRGTVREALRLLETDGLISIKRGRNGGIRASQPDLSRLNRSMALLLTSQETTVREFFVFRMLIEPAAAALAAENATDEQRDALLAIAEDDSPISDVSQSADFHGTIGEATNNDLFSIMLSLLHDVLEWHAYSEQLSVEDLKGTQRAHVAIAKAVVKGDARAAEKAMQRHLRSFEDVLRSRDRIDEPVIPRHRWVDLGAHYI